MVTLTNATNAVTSVQDVRGKRFYVAYKLTPSLQVKSQSRFLRGEKHPPAQNDSAGRGISLEAQVSVQIRIGHIGARQGEMQPSGNAQRRLVHATHHHFETRGLRDRVDLKRLGHASHFHEFHIHHVGEPSSGNPERIPKGHQALVCHHGNGDARCHAAEKAQVALGCRLFDKLEPIFLKKDNGILKTTASYFGKDKKSILVESLAIESGKKTEFLALVGLRDDGIVVRLHPILDIEKTDGVKQILAEIAKQLTGKFPQLSVGKTNLSEFLQ